MQGVRSLRMLVLAFVLLAQACGSSSGEGDGVSGSQAPWSHIEGLGRSHYIIQVPMADITRLEDTTYGGSDFPARQYRIDLSRALIEPVRTTEPITTSSLTVLRDAEYWPGLLSKELKGSTQALLFVNLFVTNDESTGHIDDVIGLDADGNWHRSTVRILDEDKAALELARADLGLSLFEALAAIGRTSLAHDRELEGDEVGETLLAIVARPEYRSDDPIAAWYTSPVQVREIAPGVAPDAVLADRVPVQTLIVVDGLFTKSVTESSFVVFHDAEGMLYGFELGVGDHQAEMFNDPTLEIVALLSDENRWPDHDVIGVLGAGDWAEGGIAPYGLTLSVSLRDSLVGGPEATLSRVHQSADTFRQDRDAALQGTTD